MAGRYLVGLAVRYLGGYYSACVAYTIGSAFGFLFLYPYTLLAIMMILSSENFHDTVIFTQHNIYYDILQYSTQY